MDAHSVSTHGARIDAPLRVFSHGYYPTLLSIYKELGVEFAPASYGTTATRFPKFDDNQTIPHDCLFAAPAFVTIAYKYYRTVAFSCYNFEGKSAYFRFINLMFGFHALPVPLIWGVSGFKLEFFKLLYEFWLILPRSIIGCVYAYLARYSHGYMCMNTYPTNTINLDQTFMPHRATTRYPKIFFASFLVLTSLSLPLNCL